MTRTKGAFASDESATAGEPESKPEPDGEAVSIPEATVVGIGGSAGGLSPLKTFFERYRPRPASHS